MNCSLKEESSEPAPLRFSLIFLLVSLFIGLLGYFYYATEKQEITEKIKEELSAIADLKAHQIINWRSERIGNAQLASRVDLIADNIENYNADPASAALKKAILDWMISFQEVFRYRSIFLMSTSGGVLLIAGKKEPAVGPVAEALAKESIRTKKLMLSDFHTSGAAEYPHLDLAAPVMSQKGTKKPVGVLLFRIDPGLFFYPFIQSWPTPSKTAETLLFRVEGAEIVYLNQLRHGAKPPLTFRIPFAEERRQAIMTSREKTTVFEGLDYRNVPVLAAVRSIADTPWYLVAKTDLEEVYAPLRERAWFTSMVIGILIVVSGMSVILWRRKKKAELRQQRLTLEYERRCLHERYDYLSKYANDIILLFDTTGAIVEANDKALSSYGFTREEFLRMNIRDVNADESLDREDPIMKIREQNGSVFESLHRRKDGSSFPVEISSRAIQGKGSNFYQSIIRDISERRQAEQKIRHSTRLYAVLSQVNQAILHTDEQQKLCREICRICGETGGFGMAWIGLIDRETNIVKPVAQYGAKDGCLETVNRAARDDPEGRGPAGRNIQNARYYVCNDISADPRLSSFKTGPDQRGYGSLAAFPITSNGIAIGDLNLYSGEVGFFDHDEIILLDEISRDISFAMENIDREVRRKAAEAALMQEKNRSEAIIAAIGRRHQHSGQELHGSVSERTPPIADRFSYRRILLQSL